LSVSPMTKRERQRDRETERQRETDLERKPKAAKPIDEQQPKESVWEERKSRRC
jgi:hypothetical protein